MPMKVLRRIRNSISYRWAQWRFQPEVIERQFAGEPFKFLIGDLFGARAYGSQRHHWPELNWVKEKGIQPGDTVVDCGANHGFTTLLFSRWAGPTGTVHAFEPNLHNVAILKENIRLNGLKNVVCHPIALDCQSRHLQISIHPNSAVQERPTRKIRTKAVPSATLDDVLGDAKVNFVKIDVEGFELQVLRGARRVLAQRPRLDLELHVVMYDDPLQKLTTILQLLDLDRYQVEVQPVVDGDIRPFDPNIDTVEAWSKCEIVHLFCY
jgi:FkbM family methyltransferase